MDKKLLEKIKYFPILNEYEYKRISNVDNAKDYLLKLRADIIVDNMRLFRVYRNKALIREKNWSLEESFTTKPYDMFLKAVDDETRKKCTDIVYGNIFSNDPNGYIFNTKFGPIITISESLVFFCKFMNMALLQFEDNIPEYVCHNAIRIAIRVMLKTETLDFLMDPRGIVTENIHHGMHAPIDYQLMSIVGHEFSHYMLGHLKESRSVIKPIYFAISNKDKEYMQMKVYSQSQEEELQADLKSLELPQLDNEEYKKLFESTILWFGSLELYEAAIDVICPRNPWDTLSHPPARDRMDNILNNAKKPYDYNELNWKMFKNTINQYKKWLIKDVSLNLYSYEMYGSAYLDEPNSEWRGKELIDRVDYY